MIGKHFLIKSFKGCKPARHYTICNAMQPDIYYNLMDLLTAGTTSQAKLPSVSKRNLERLLESQVSAPHSSISRTFSWNESLDSEDKSSMLFVIKNYNAPEGLSQKFFTFPNDDFEVRGPMGKALNPQKAGLHMAFAGGTGILPFMDLVA